MKIVELSVFTEKCLSLAVRNRQHAVFRIRFISESVMYTGMHTAVPNYHLLLFMSKGYCCRKLNKLTSMTESCCYCIWLGGGGCWGRRWYFVCVCLCVVAVIIVVSFLLFLLLINCISIIIFFFFFIYIFFNYYFFNINFTKLLLILCCVTPLHPFIRYFLLYIFI